MTLKDFLESYTGFNFNTGEIVVIDQRKGKHYICEWKNGKLDHPFHDFKDEMEKDVYDWTHTAKTMLITL